MAFRNPLLVPLPALVGGGARRRLRDPGARPRPRPRGDPRGPLRPEPARPGPAGPSPRPPRGDQGDREDTRTRSPRAPRDAAASQGIARAEPAHAASGCPSAALARPRELASTPIATSHAASPFDLNRTMSASVSRPRSSPDTTSCSSCTSSQSRTPPATGSIRSPDSSLACSRESQQTKVARSRTTLSSSRAPRVVRPDRADERAVAEPLAAEDGVARGRRRHDDVLGGGILGPSPGSASVVAQNALSCSGVRQ